MVEELTLIKAKSKVENIDNKIEFYLQKKELEISKLLPQAMKMTKQKVDGGRRSDKYIDYVIKCDEIDNILDKLYQEKMIYEEFIEKELIRLNKYKEVEQLIIYYKEQCIDKYTWQQIALKVNYSISQCKRIYRKWVQKRDVD